MRKTLKKLGWNKQKIDIGIEDFELFHFALFDMIFKNTNPDFEEMYIMRQERTKKTKKCSSCFFGLFSRKKKKKKSRTTKGQ